MNVTQTSTATQHRTTERAIPTIDMLKAKQLSIALRVARKKGLNMSRAIALLSLANRDLCTGEITLHINEYGEQILYNSVSYILRDLHTSGFVSRESEGMEDGGWCYRYSLSSLGIRTVVEMLK